MKQCFHIPGRWVGSDQSQIEFIALLSYPGFIFLLESILITQFTRNRVKHGVFCNFQEFGLWSGRHLCLLSQSLTFQIKNKQDVSGLKNSLNYN